VDGYPERPEILSIAQFFYIPEVGRTDSVSISTPVANRAGWIHGKNLARGLVFLCAYLCAWLSLGAVAFS